MYTIMNKMIWPLLVLLAMAGVGDARIVPLEGEYFSPFSVSEHVAYVENNAKHHAALLSKDVRSTKQGWRPGFRGL